MTYAQQQQPQYRPNRAALWVNDRKTAANQPDYKGNLEISWALLQELNAAFNAGQYTQDGGGQPCIKLDLAIYAQQGGVSASGRPKPIMSGQLSTVTETQNSAAARQQARQQYAQAPAPAAMPQQPQYAQPQPAQQPQWPQAPAQPQQYAPAPQAPAQPVYQQPPQPQAPAPAPMAPAPAPTAPAAPVAPMPGAIHGQPPAPAGPAPVLPPGF